MNSKLYETLKTILLSTEEYKADDGNLNLAKIEQDGFNAEPQLLNLLLSNDELKKIFFITAENTTIYNRDRFLDFIANKNFLANSYTKYQNKIGLYANNKPLKTSTDVVLNFPFKDCILEGGQTKDDKKQNELFFNETLAFDEIDKLLKPKVLANAKKYTKDGEQKVESFTRDESGTIKDNLIIKGNNLIALHSLKREFRGKVKLIYIDPPYNTGNDSFNYNDNFNHSTWLTFMKNRLEVARELLRVDGVIFVQCDDNEQAYLKVLMDEVFGRENFISTVTVVSDARTRNYEALSKTHEFICVYAKSSTYNLYQHIETDKNFSYSDDEGGFDIYELRNRNIVFNSKNRPNLLYPFYLNTKNKDKNGFYEISLKQKKGWIEVLPLKSNDVQTVWRWGKDKASENLNTILFGKKSKSGFQIIKKYRKNTKPVSTVWNEKEILTDRGTLQVKALFGSKLFDFPKPEKLLETLISLTTQTNDVVLDFHLGSGTTCAVAHKMGRQYIGVEQMDYIEDIAVERMKKVIAGEQGGISKAVNWQGGGEFIYCELLSNTQKIVNQITNCQTKEQLAKIKQTIDKDSVFIDYRVKLEFLDGNDESWDELSLKEQQKILIAIFDKNQLYVSYSEIEDTLFNVGESDKKLSRSFYKK